MVPINASAEIARSIREGLRLIEAAYKQELRIYGKDGISDRRTREKAEDLYYRGNKIISKLLADLDGKDALNALSGRIGGNIR